MTMMNTDTSISVGNNNYRNRIYDTRAAQYVIGALVHKPLLLQDEKYNLTSTLFVKPIHQMVFVAIANLANAGALKITEQDIDTEISQHSGHYSFYEKENGPAFTKEAIIFTDGSDLIDFDNQYLKLQKLSMLRDLDTIGINIKPFYDVDAINGEQDVQLEKLSLNTIPDLIREKLASIENEHVGKELSGAKTVGDGLEELISSFKDKPDVGLPLNGSILTTVTRGARQGKLFLYSSGTGGGKTRFLISNACKISLPYLDEEGKVVFPHDGPAGLKKILFITTEMDHDELQTLVVANVSGVDEDHITLHDFTPDEKLRVQRAVKLIKKYEDNFLIERFADPSIELVKTRLVKHIVADKTKYIYYDYIFTSPSLIKEFSAANIREDVALMMLTNTLKEIAMIYTVHMETATQVNDRCSKIEVGIRDQECIRGSKAVADKVDIGLIGISINQKEKEAMLPVLTELWNQGKIPQGVFPNIVIDIYKNRRGKNVKMKIWRYFNFGICRAQDLFITDADYNYVALKELDYGEPYINDIIEELKEEEQHE